MKRSIFASIGLLWLFSSGCAPDYSHLDARRCDTNAQCPSGQCLAGYCALADNPLDNADVVQGEPDTAPDEDVEEVEDVEETEDAREPEAPEDIMEDIPDDEPPPDDTSEDTSEDVEEDAPPDDMPCDDEVMDCDLQIVQTDPARHTADTSSEDNIEITFSATLDPDTIEGQIIVRGSISGLIEVSAEVSGAAVTLDPARSLQIGELITVLVRTGIQSEEGARMARPYQWQFRIKPPPNESFFVLSHSPGFDHHIVDVACADFDNDGHLDLFVLSGSDNTCKLLLGTGDGFFSEPMDTEISGGFRLATGDIDNDGDIDVFLASAITPNQLVINEGGGNFTASLTFQNHDTRYTLMADFNGDGNLDVYLAHTGRPDEVLLGDGQGGLTSTGQQIGGMDNGYADTGDLDNDGDLDVITTGLTRRILRNSGTGQFGILAEVSPVREQITEFGDLNRDGHLDYLLGTDEEDEIFINDGEGRFTNTVFNPGNLDRTYGGQLLDLNGDGLLDAFLHGRGGGRVLWGDGEGNLVDSGQNFAGGEDVEHCLGDLDQDGDIDAVLVEFNGMRLHIALNRPEE